MNVRIFEYQAEKLKESGQGAAIIRYAYQRYKRGDFGCIVVEKSQEKEKRQKFTTCQLSSREKIARFR